MRRHRHRLGRAHAVGSFNGALAALPAHDLGAVADQGRGRARPASSPRDVDEVILGQILPAGRARTRRARPRQRRHPGREHRPGASTSCAARACARWRSAQQIAAAIADRRRRRPGEHEPGAALRASAQRPQDGRPRLGRHHDQGRPVGRLPRLPHGQDRREHRAPLADHPRATRTASPSPRRTRPRRRRRPAASRTRSSR